MQQHIPKLVVIGIALILIGTGAFFSFRLFANKSSESPGPSRTRATDTSKSGPQTYIDANYNFSLVYPEDWSVRRLNTLKTYFLPNTNASQVGVDGYEGDIVVKVQYGAATNTLHGNIATRVIDEVRFAVITNLVPASTKEDVFRSIVESFKVVKSSKES